MSKTLAKSTETTTASNPIMVPIGKLIRDPDNVRRTRTEEGIEALADNILAEGLLQNLIVRKVKGGKFAVAGGERRREALGVLVKRKVLKATDTVPCKLIDTAHVSASLSENIHRLAMHPADQFEAWAKMRDDGLTVAEIAKRHGATTLLVEKRLKLGRLSPVLLDALRTDEIDVETACAFALTDDRKRQETAYEALKAQWNGLSPRQVRAALTEKDIAGSSKLAQFVGRDAYEAEGGQVHTDLFGDEVYFIDAELLTKLGTAKLQAEAARLKAAGWAWIEFDFDHDYRAGERMRRIHPQTVALPEKEQAERDTLAKRYDEIAEAAENGDEALMVECEAIDARLKELSDMALAYQPAEQQVAGGLLSLHHDGTLYTQIGLVRPEDDPQLAESKRKAAEEKAQMPAQFTKALRDDLAALRREIIQAAFLKNPALANDFFSFHVIRQTLSSGYVQNPLNFTGAQATNAACVSKNGDMGTIAGRQAVQKKIEKLPLNWLEIADDADSFNAFLALSKSDKTALVAYAASLMVQPQLKDDPRAEPTLELAAQLMGVDIASNWTPDAEFFGRISKKHMTEITESVIGPEFVQRHAKGKKSAFAKAMGEAFEPSKQSPDIAAEAAQRIATWVPECMACS